MLSREDILRRLAELPADKLTFAAKAVQALWGNQPRKTKAAIALEQLGWRGWVTSLFKNYARAPFASFHCEFWEWVWSIESGKSAASFVAAWYRGAAKSTSVQLACACMGARGTRRYALYVSETQDQADNHVLTVGSLLAKSSVEQYYPDLAQKKVNKYGTSEGWRRNRYRTASGFTIDALGLDTARRGVKLEEQRPDLIIFDDIDGKHDTAAVIQKKLEIMTTSLIPAGAPDLIVIFAQNLIHKDSICSQLVDGRADFLANRIVSGPYPALRGFRCESKAIGSGYVITAGEPTWEGFGLDACQRALDHAGLNAFQRERQNEVDIAMPGALFPEFDERYHVITDSEFIEGYAALGVHIDRDETGRAIMPEHFAIGRAQDYGTTLKHPCVTGWVAVPPEGDPLYGRAVFTHRELVMPDWLTAKDNVAENAVSPGRIAAEIHRLERMGREGERIELSLLSHEQSAALNTYAYDLPEHLCLEFDKWRPDRRQGIAQIQNYLQIDRNKAHPFRRYPLDYPDPELFGKPLMGCPRLFFVVADEQGELYMDSEGQLRVRQAVDARGLARARWEMPRYRLPIDSTGQESDLPIKVDDDWIDQFKAIADKFFPPPNEMPDDDQIRRRLAEVNAGLELDRISKMAPGRDCQMAASIYNVRQQQREREEREEEENWSTGSALADWINRRRGLE